MTNSGDKPADRPADNQADPVLLAHLLNESVDKRLDILRRVADVGSISKAARGAGMSYKTAWQALEALTNLAGGPLVEKAVGGREGGGTRLTPRGEDVLRLNEALLRARRAVLEEFRHRGSTPVTMAGTHFSISMRNQIPARIHTMKLGSALVRLILSIDKDHLIRASVTKESAQLLGLREGMSVIALCKATGVEVFSQPPETADNLLQGTVIHCDRAAHGGECTVRLPSGLTIVGFARGNHGLHVHGPAWVVMPCDNIAVALAE